MESLYKFFQCEYHLRDTYILVLDISYTSIYEDKNPKCRK
jgi:hypothetical protein